MTTCCIKLVIVYKNVCSFCWPRSTFMPPLQLGVPEALFSFEVRPIQSQLG